MLAERIGTTLQTAREELKDAKKKRDDDKAVLKKQLSADLAAINDRYRKKAKAFTALVGALESKSEPPAE